MKCPHCGLYIPKKLIVRESGRIGGRKTRKRGSAYFAHIAGMRKNRRGGRPSIKTSKTMDVITTLRRGMKVLDEKNTEKLIEAIKNI